MAIIGGEERRVTGVGNTMRMMRRSLKETNPPMYKLIEPVFMTAFGGVTGAVFGGSLAMVLIAPMTCRNPRALAPLTRTQCVRGCALEFSVLTAAANGVDSILRGIRGKDDLTSRLISGYASGMALSYLRQGLKGKSAHARSLAALCAFCSGTAYMITN